MEHVVFSAAQDGAGEEFRRVASLEEAVRVVEHLRNDLGITDPSVFALTPVPVAFRTYYRVEVPGVEEEPAEQAPTLDLEPAELPHADALIEDSESAEADSDMSEYVFDGNSDMEVPGILPDSAAIPASRQDHDADHSLGYFAR